MKATVLNVLLDIYCFCVHCICYLMDLALKKHVSKIIFRNETDIISMSCMMFIWNKRFFLRIMLCFFKTI